MLDQSHYVNQLVCAVGGVLDFIAKSEWRGGEQKKLEKLEFDMPSIRVAFRKNPNFCFSEFSFETSNIYSKYSN